MSQVFPERSFFCAKIPVRETTLHLVIMSPKVLSDFLRLSSSSIMLMDLSGTDQDFYRMFLNFGSSEFFSRLD